MYEQNVLGHVTGNLHYNVPELLENGYIDVQYNVTDNRDQAIAMSNRTTLLWYTFSNWQKDGYIVSNAVSNIMDEASSVVTWNSSVVYLHEEELHIFHMVSNRVTSDLAFINTHVDHLDPTYIRRSSLQLSSDIYNSKEANQAMIFDDTYRVFIIGSAAGDKYYW